MEMETLVCGNDFFCAPVSSRSEKNGFVQNPWCVRDLACSCSVVNAEMYFVSTTGTVTWELAGILPSGSYESLLRSSNLYQRVSVLSSLDFCHLSCFFHFCRCFHDSTLLLVLFELSSLLALWVTLLKFRMFIDSTAHSMFVWCFLVSAHSLFLILTLLPVALTWHLDQWTHWIDEPLCQRVGWSAWVPISLR